MKLLVLLISSVIFLGACSSSKEARNDRHKINGKWQLKTISSEGISGTTKSILFDEAELSCFIESTWTFNQNNSLGSYTFNGTGENCGSLKRDIRWSIFEAAGEEPLFQFKRLDSKLKNIDESGGGYRFSIIQIDNSTMKLKSNFTFEGKPAAFIYNFVKI
ncbi:MAG: lipocalin family protein [Bacteroidetes bacterium]|nr:lipocalin family protein [Bacteroidota bacterium]